MDESRSQGPTQPANEENYRTNELATIQSVVRGGDIDEEKVYSDEGQVKDTIFK